jgi:hypothetical protein
MATKKAVTKKKVVAPKEPTFPIYAVVTQSCENFEGWHKTYADAEKWIQEHEELDRSEDVYYILTITGIKEIFAHTDEVRLETGDLNPQDVLDPTID